MKKPEIVALLLVALIFLVSIAVYQSLPDVLASHWDINGNVNGYMGKFWGTFLLPVIAVAILGILAFFVRADPLIVATKKWKIYPEWVFVIIIGFMAYIQFLCLAFNLGYKFNFTTAILPSFGLLFIFLGHLMQGMKRNYTVGIRTPWTLADNTVWEKTHERGGKLFKAAGLIAFLGLAFPKYAFHFLFFPVVFAALYSVFYSYFVYKATVKPGRKR